MFLVASGVKFFPSFPSYSLFVCLSLNVNTNAYMPISLHEFSTYRQFPSLIGCSIINYHSTMNL